MNETTSQRTARLLSMSNAQLVMHAQDLTVQRDELLSALVYVISDLELRASMKLDEDERDIVDIGCGAYEQAKRAIAFVTGGAA